MEVIAPRIPYSYIEPRTTLTWREVAYGLENELLAKDGPVELAVVHVGLLKNPPPDILDLAWGPNEFDVRDIVKTLANRENEEPEENIQRKWLYLVLSWFYDHRDSLDDPLEQVEMTYSGFGYPKRIAGLIRYMPTKEPTLGSATANTHRLFEKWASYLDEEGRIFAPK